MQSIDDIDGYTKHRILHRQPQILSKNNFYMTEKQLDVKEIIFMIDGIPMHQLCQKLKNSKVISERLGHSN
ncbi:hypothetical protein B5Z22_04075 [Bacillus velezensis]|nr:hypothetical protein B5Z20_09560 [Bacillus velezensis]OQV56573.1 hypothetical protein B5Z22_04075 [Bacillus velezensis]OQV63129.1 hypothetical protein B5Z24_04075 [Bacillus velezensis]